MSKNVLIISTTETFIVKGLEMKLKGIGIETVHASTDMKSLENNAEDAELFVYYMDETVRDVPDVLVFLNDICTEKEKKVVLIGTKIEYETVTKHIGKTNILEWFERPLNMEDFLAKMHEYMDEASAEARKKCILIVDDDVTYMRMIRDWLKDIYRVGMANSGIQAITWLAKNKADLILLDYEMPITPGPQVLEMLKTEAQTSTIPVMFLTGKSDRDSIMKVLELKPVDYLLKTIDRDGLRDKLQKYFLKKRV